MVVLQFDFYPLGELSALTFTNQVGAKKKKYFLCPEFLALF